MNTLLRFLVYLPLKWFAKLRLARSKATVIGITGSVGKTTTKDAVVHVLQQKYRVLAAKGGYNTDIGVPLMILEQQTALRSPLRWMTVLIQGFLTALKPINADYIVVEMGVDKPRDMKVLTSILNPDIAIFTAVAKVHTAEKQFKSEQDILAEKQLIFRKQRHHQLAVINIDDELVRSCKKHIAASCISYGTRSEAQFALKNLRSSKSGISFTAKFGERMANFKVPVLGKFHAYNIAPALIVGAEAGISMNDMAEALTTFSLPKGRMNPIAGKRGSVIIDSSYNANPKSVIGALTVMNEMQAERRIVCLGQMNELGKDSIKEHKLIGQLVPGAADMLITVYGHAKYIASEAEASGMSSKKIYHFKTSEEAGEFLQTKLKEGDVVLVKGSQNKVYMERLIEKIMAHPKEAKSLLVRQERHWRN